VCVFAKVACRDFALFKLSLCLILEEWILIWFWGRSVPWVKFLFSVSLGGRLDKEIRFRRCGIGMRGREGWSGRQVVTSAHFFLRNAILDCWVF